MNADNPIEGSFENSDDEREILANKDETDPGSVDKDDEVMGAGANELVPEQAEGFLEGQVDLVDQMRRQTEHTLRQTHRD